MTKKKKKKIFTPAPEMSRSFCQTEIDKKKKKKKKKRCER